LKAPAILERALHGIWQRKGLCSTLLLPLSWIARAVIARKRHRYENYPDRVYHCPLPVVVVGNIYVGGTGKTPVTIALAEALRAHGWHPGIVSRGYGVDIGERARSGQGVLDPARYGDEPALIAQVTQAPIAVHPDRALAIKRLSRDYPDVDVIIADDGLQHLALGRDLEIAVQDGRGTGNGRVLPAGPLREPASRLKYVDFVITNLPAGLPGPAAIDTPARQLTMSLIPVKAVQLSTGVELDWDSWLSEHGQQQVSAVAAIGQPQRFFSMLQAAGLQLAHSVALPDHHAYDSSPFGALPASPILVTAKDAVKCVRFNDARLWSVHVAPVFSDPEWITLAHDMLRMIAQHKNAVAERAPRD
jgi:tetraacyldisaccharide 4'-kinase